MGVLKDNYTLVLNAMAGDLRNRTVVEIETLLVSYRDDEISAARKQANNNPEARRASKRRKDKDAIRPLDWNSRNTQE